VDVLTDKLVWTCDGCIAVCITLCAGVCGMPDPTAVVGHSRSRTVSQSHSIVHPRLLSSNRCL